MPECIYEMPNLEILIANDNKMSSINVPALSKLKYLANLDLSNNNIGYVPPELGNLIHLRFVLLVISFFLYAFFQYFNNKKLLSTLLEEEKQKQVL